MFIIIRNSVFYRRMHSHLAMTDIEKQVLVRTEEPVAVNDKDGDSNLQAREEVNKGRFCKKIMLIIGKVKEISIREFSR